MMRAMVLERPGTPLALRERPVPQPGPGTRTSEALGDLREGRLRGAAVLVPYRRG